MDWINCITKAIDYIEENLTDDLSVERVSEMANISPFYFQKGFSMLCGFSVSEYIRQRRLAAAGSEVAYSKARVIDIAMKYGFESADSFTKAFTRFHGTTPNAVRRAGTMIKTFAPLKIIFSLKGGSTMEYRFEEKEAFTIMGVSKTFTYEEAKEAIPKFWQDYFGSGSCQVCGMFGINIDETMGGKEFDYIIADECDKEADVKQGLVKLTIPSFTWAIFPCRGAMPDTMHEVNKQIYSEWLPNNKEYEFCAGYCIEMYNDPKDYKNGTNDENYYSEFWIPVRKK